MHLVSYLRHYVFFGLFSYSYTLSVTVLTFWVAPLKMVYNYIGLGFNGAQTNCGIAHILGSINFCKSVEG